MVRLAEKPVPRPQSELNERKRKREIRDELGMLLEHGRVLAGKCADESKPAPVAEADEWANKTEEFLRKSLGEGYVARFRNAAGLPMTATSISDQQHRNLWAGIYTRNARLSEFIAELKD